MPANKLTKEQAIDECRKAKTEFQALKEIPAVNQAIGILGLLGEKIGYTPTFRALIMDMAPEESIRWKDK